LLCCCKASWQPTGSAASKATVGATVAAAAAYTGFLSAASKALYPALQAEPTNEKESTLEKKSPCIAWCQIAAGQQQQHDALLIRVPAY
jgi:CelD/BcsL family acetyltransferase involved in cellulose biosynthesis